MDPENPLSVMLNMYTHTHILEKKAQPTIERPRATRDQTRKAILNFIAAFAVLRGGGASASSRLAHRI